MNKELELGILCIGYIIWIVIMNWGYIREYKGKGVIRRGSEWDNPQE